PHLQLSTPRALPLPPPFLFFFFTHPPTPDLYPLSLHDALPICRPPAHAPRRSPRAPTPPASPAASLAAPSEVSPQAGGGLTSDRSEEHTSELQSLTNLVCRLLLEKKKKHTTRLASPANSPAHTL